MSICTLLGATTRPPVYQRLFKKGIVIHPHLHVRIIEGGKDNKDNAVLTLITENAWSKTMGELIGYEDVVYAFGGRAEDALYKQLEGKAECYLVGDAFAPRTLQHAILEGHTFARKI